MGDDKRREKRFKRRLRVVFETEGGRVGGYTTNLSQHGMEVASAVVLLPGTLLRGKVELPDGRELTLETKVRWARKTQGTFSIMREKSMGLEILGPPPPQLLLLLDGAREDVRRGTESAPGQSSATRSAPARPAASAPAPVVGTPGRPASPTPVPAVVTPVRSTAPTPPPLAATPVRPPPAKTPLPSGPAVTGVAVGLEGTVVLPIAERNAPLSAAQAASIVERVVAHVLANLAADMESRAQELVLTIVDTEPLPLGARLQARARVQKVDGRVVELSIDLSVAGRSIATARHTRLLVRRSPP